MEETLKYYEKFNISHERIEAVDGNDLDAQTITKSTLKKGAIACTLSHMKIWEKILVSDYETSIIFEDDIKINYGYSDFIFEKLLECSKHTQYDMLLLGHTTRGKQECYAGTQINDYVYKPNKCYHGTHGYVISKIGANKLLKIFSEKKLTHTVDDFKQISKHIIMLSVIPETNVSNCGKEMLVYVNDYYDSDTS